MIDEDVGGHLCQNTKFPDFDRGSSAIPQGGEQERMSDFTSTLKSRVSALAENARDLTLDFEAASGSRFFDNDDQTMKEVQALLSSRLDREKLEALRRLVAVYSPSIRMSLFHVVDVSRNRCVGLLCLCHSTHRFSQPRNQKVGLHLPPTLCRVES